MNIKISNCQLCLIFQNAARIAKWGALYLAIGQIYCVTSHALVSVWQQEVLFNEFTGLKGGFEVPSQNGAAVVYNSRNAGTCRAVAGLKSQFVSTEQARAFRLPPQQCLGAGTAFLAELFASGVWVDTPENRARLTCPGPGAERVRADVDYARPATLGADDSAYAARDGVRFPLVKFPSGGAELEALVACDNAHAANHDGCTNLLYSDGSVVVLVDAELVARGRLAAGVPRLLVGPDSPLPELQKLTRE